MSVPDNQRKLFLRHNRARRCTCRKCARWLMPRPCPKCDGAKIAAIDTADQDVLAAAASAMYASGNEARNLDPRLRDAIAKRVCVFVCEACQYRASGQNPADAAVAFNFELEG